jgi:anaerobic magnesium-protoporphyrin IX monomethyl ester cyclase
MRILLVNPPLRSPTNRFGIGFQVPLGLAMVGGPLVDQGHQVSLLDADALGLSPRQVAGIAQDRRADCVMVGHTGSTAANPVSLEVFRALKDRKPEIATVYGGVYPTYAADTLLQDEPSIDIVVRGEGEATACDLAARLAGGRRDLSAVKGVSWRGTGGEPRRNPDRPIIPDLDSYRVGWELLDWRPYHSFGLPGPAAGIQFSRGCPCTCTYCGQWTFWKRWRSRSVESFVQDVQLLHDRYGVRSLWLADENWGHDPEVLRRILTGLSSRRLSLEVYCSMCAGDVARDTSLLPLYREAGIRFILMGVESPDAEVLQSVRKDNPHSLVKEVVSRLRRHGILSIVNYVFGLRGESHRTMRRALRSVVDLDPDFFNALYFTPHGWTEEGRRLEPQRIIQTDQRRWCYRNQVVEAGLRPWQLFLWIKAVEAAAHLRPSWAWRLFRHPFPEVGRILRWSFRHIGMVWLYEIWDQIRRVRFRRPGSLEPAVVSMLLPGRARKPTAAEQRLEASRARP